MKGLRIFRYEWKHFTRKPFKLVAVLLFIIAGIYGLHNGSSLYHEQNAAIEKIKGKYEEEKQEYFSPYESGNLIPENRPWMNLGSPYWAMRYNPTYRFKPPSPAMVYSIGQAEQYGFYKRVTFRSSPYDADMAQEIANPERLQTGSLDFSFVLLFLLPLLLLILLYNIKSAEYEQGFLPLIEVQTASKNSWLLARMAFYFLLTFIVVIGLLVYGATLTGVFDTAKNAFGQMLLYTTLYLLFWSLIYYVILKNGKRILSNTLKMVGIWLVFAFVIPAIVHQSVSIMKPVNLMTDFIEVREMRQELYDDENLLDETLVEFFPEIVNSPVYEDSIKINAVKRRSAAAVINEFKKESIEPIKQESHDKNKLIRNTYWFNPVTFFQNKLNRISQTHFDDYQHFRNVIQIMVDKHNSILVEELWNDTKVDKDKYLEIRKRLNQ